MDFKPASLFNDCIKEHKINSNVLISATPINYLRNLIVANDYTFITQGMKAIHDNKDFYYLDPNNINASRICQVLFHLVHFGPEDNNYNSKEDMTIIYNNEIVSYLTLKESYDVTYDPIKIINYIKLRHAEIMCINTIFIYVTPKPKIKTIKIAWL